jgi:hypothetical protein
VDVEDCIGESAHSRLRQVPGGAAGTVMFVWRGEQRG